MAFLRGKLYRRRIRLAADFGAGHGGRRKGKVPHDFLQKMFPYGITKVKIGRKWVAFSLENNPVRFLREAGVDNIAFVLRCTEKHAETLQKHAVEEGVLHMPTAVEIWKYRQRKRKGRKKKKGPAKKKPSPKAKQ